MSGESSLPLTSGPELAKPLSAVTNVKEVEGEPNSENLQLVWEKRLRELWIEALGFIPISFVDDVINEVNEHMYVMLSKIEMFVREYISDESTVSEKMTAIDVLLEAAVDKNFDVFELYALKNIFHFNSSEPVVPFHYEGLFSDPKDEEIEALVEEFKHEHQKLVQAELFSKRAKQIQTYYTIFAKEVQEAVSKLEALVSKVNQKDMTFLRSNLAFSLSEFRRLFEEHKKSTELLNKSPTIRFTQRDLYLQQSTLASIGEVASTLNENPFSTLQLDSDLETMKTKPWTLFVDALGL